MAYTQTYQNDLSINYNGETINKASLELTPTGDLKLVNGKDKLIAQLIRKVVSQSNNIPLNTPKLAESQLNVLLRTIMRNFKKVQVYETDRYDPALAGYAIYKREGPRALGRDTSDVFTKLTKDPVTHMFVDTKVENGVLYEYGLAKTLTTGSEYRVTEQISATPSAFPDKQNPVIGSNTIIVPGNQQLTFYVDTNRLYRKSELLENILDITAYQSETEPRKFIVEVQIQSLLEETVTLSLAKQLATI
jgi:hypothetical protein